MSDQPSDQPDQPMEDAAPADAAPPPPSPADVILQRAQRNSRGVDREAEAAEQRWASLGGGSALGDGTTEVNTPAPTQPQLETLDVRVTFFADGFTVEEQTPKEMKPEPPKPRRGGTATLQDFAAPPRPPTLPTDFPELRPFDSDESREFLDHLARDEAPSREALQRAMGRQRRAAPAPEKFTGSGQTLGGSAAPAVAEDAPLPEAPVVDASKPVAKFRLRLATGKALAVELNQDHTVGHLRAFIGAQGAGGAPYDLLAGFPPKPLLDAAQTVGAAGLAGGAVSQKLRA